MESSRQQKQAYLRSQVIEKGYQPDQFIDYLNSVNISADIDSLQYKKLVEIVQQFKQKKFKEDEQKIRAKIEGMKHGDKGMSMQPLQILLTAEQKPLSKPKTILYVLDILFRKNMVIHLLLKINLKRLLSVQNLLKELIAKLLLLSKLVSKEILLYSPKRQSSGGLFGIGSVSFLMFKIETSDYKWEVRRRYSDFQWLRTIIQKFYPTYIIPPLPKKNAAKRTVRDLQKRMHILTNFLNDIVNIPELFNCKYVEGFLSLSADDKFEELKKEANRKEFYGTISTLQTPTGEFTVKLTNQRKTYHEELQKYINNAQLLYKDINRNSKALQGHYIQQTNTLYRMGNQFAQLHNIMKNFNQKLPNLEQNVLNDTYITLNNMMVQWGNIVRNQHGYLEQSFNYFFKYSRHELYSMRELLTKVYAMQAEYFKNKQLLEKKKQKIFALGDINKWQIPTADFANVSGTVIKNKVEAMKIMLPRQSLEIQKQKLKYAFYSSQFFEHSYKKFAQATNKICQNFKNFSVKIKVQGNQLTQLWTQIATNFADPKKKLVEQAPIPIKDEQYEDA